MENYSPQTPNDGFRNGELFGMAALRNGGPTPRGEQRQGPRQGVEKEEGERKGRKNERRYGRSEERRGGEWTGSRNLVLRVIDKSRRLRTTRRPIHYTHNVRNLTS